MRKIKNGSKCFDSKISGIYLTFEQAAPSLFSTLNRVTKVQRCCWM